jgi:hypothetical protein
MYYRSCKEKNHYSRTKYLIDKAYKGSWSGDEDDDAYCVICDSVPPSVFCVECDLVLCTENGCDRYIHRAKSKRSHKRIKLEDFKGDLRVTINLKGFNLEDLEDPFLIDDENENEKSKRKKNSKSKKSFNAQEILKWKINSKTQDRLDKEMAKAKEITTKTAKKRKNSSDYITKSIKQKNRSDGFKTQNQTTKNLHSILKNPNCTLQNPLSTL